MAMQEVPEKKPRAAALTWGERVDRALFDFFPRWGARRLACRRQFQAAEDHALRLSAARFEGADHDRTRGRHWWTPRLSPDSILETDLETLRDRSRNLAANNCFAAGAISGRVVNVVGEGIRAQPRIKPKAGVLTQNQADWLNAGLAKDWAKQSETIGTSGRESIYDLQQQAVRNWDTDGESFPVLRDLGDADKPVPLAVEMVDADRVSTPPSEMGNPLVRLGVERDEKGKIVAYHIQRTNPYDTRQIKFVWDRVPANRVCHLYTRIYPHQSRGLPWFTPVLPQMKDLADFCEAELITKQIAACYGPFIKTVGDPEEMATGAATGEARDRRREEIVEPGRITYMRTDEEVSFGQPNPQGLSSLGAYVETQLRSIAAGLNYPYELLAKNWTRSSFSAGRLALIDGRQAFRSIQRTLKEKFLVPLWRRFVAEWLIVNAEAIKEQGIDLADSDREPEVFEAVAWIAPGWPWIDPTKDVEASAEAVKHDLSSLADELASRGKEFGEHMTERLAENTVRLEQYAALRKRAESLGLSVAELMFVLGDTSAANAQIKAMPPEDDGDEPTDDEPAASGNKKRRQPAGAAA